MFSSESALATSTSAASPQGSDSTPAAHLDILRRASFFTADKELVTTRPK